MRLKEAGCYTASGEIGRAACQQVTSLGHTCYETRGSMLSMS